LIGDEDIDDKGAWRRGRSVLLEIDKNLAAAPQAAYRVRALRNAGDTAMTETRDAGQLTRRDIKRPAPSLDFPRVLGSIRTTVTRELAGADAPGSPAGRLAIVFFAAHAPLADAVTAGIYSELADKAHITWIVPEELTDLISPAFAEKGSRILPDHRAIASEVISLLHRNAAANEAIPDDEHERSPR
jgi:hypothetical protein